MRLLLAFTALYPCFISAFNVIRHSRFVTINTVLLGRPWDGMDGQACIWERVLWKSRFFSAMRYIPSFSKVFLALFFSRSSWVLLGWLLVALFYNIFGRALSFGLG
jgi:hypothetical protein